MVTVHPLIALMALLALCGVQGSRALSLRGLDEPEEDLPYTKQELLAIMQDLSSTDIDSDEAINPENIEAMGHYADALREEANVKELMRDMYFNGNTASGPSIPPAQLLLNKSIMKQVRAVLMAKAKSLLAKQIVKKLSF